MTISLKETLVLGTRKVFYNLKFIWLLLGTNIALAFILSTPIYFILTDNLGHSILSQKLLHTFDFMWYTQLRAIYHNTFGALPIVIYSVVGVYALIQTFFLAGLFSIFNIPKKNHFVDFFYGGVKYWFRFTKILLITLAFMILSFKINDYLGDLIAWIFKNSDTVIYDFIFRSLRYILLIFLIGLVSGISDYIKAAIVIEDRKDVIKTIIATLAFIKKNFKKTFSVYLLVAVLGAIGAIIYNVVERFIPNRPQFFLILTFILQQMLIIFRLFIRMLFCSTEVILYQDLSAETVTAEVKEIKLGE